MTILLIIIVDICSCTCADAVIHEKRKYFSQNVHTVQENDDLNAAFKTVAVYCW